MIHDEKTTEIELPNHITAKKGNVVRVHFPPTAAPAPRQLGLLQALYRQRPWLFRIAALVAVIALSLLVL